MLLLLLQLLMSESMAELPVRVVATPIVDKYSPRSAGWLTSVFNIPSTRRHNEQLAFDVVSVASRPTLPVSDMAFSPL
jgi:hypothetical protein